MKRYAVFLIALLISGCASTSPMKELESQLSDALSQNAKLQEQVRSLEKERDDLKTGSLANVGEVRVGIETAMAIARNTAPYMVVRQSRKVEFMLRDPDRWIAIWVLDLEDDEGRYQGTVVIDAVTGKVLNVSNAPDGG